jgi:hypothetical protein
MASMIAMDRVFRFRVASLLNASENSLAKVLLRYFRREEAQQEVKRPRFREFIRPDAFVAGQENPLVALIDDMSPFSAATVDCQWRVAEEGGELLDGFVTAPDLDASLNQYRCSNRLRISGDQRSSGTGPKVTVNLVQKGR